MQHTPSREVRVDLSAIRTNVTRLSRSGADGRQSFIADVAGDAYGHGAVQVARAALEGGAASLLVRSDTELTELRDAGIDAPCAVSLRVGSIASASLFGIGPMAEPLGLAPAMRVSARVMALKTIDAGEPVSYGYTWRAQCTTNLALVPLGYADGLPRSASNRARLSLGGADRLIVGRVAMNALVLELETDEVELDDEAVLFGDARVGGTVDSFAASLATQSAGGLRSVGVLEVTSGFGAKLERSWI